MQTQPRILAQAIFPAPVKIGGTQLRPVTLGALVLLHGLQSPYAEGADLPLRLETIVAGYILSDWQAARAAHQAGQLGDRAQAWADQNAVASTELDPLIRQIIEAGFSSHALTDFPSQSGGAIETVNEYGKGLGYLLTLIETLCSSYSWSIEAVLDMPLITVYALDVAHRINAGAEWRAPNYFERDLDFGALAAQIAAAAAEAAAEENAAGQSPEHSAAESAPVSAYPSSTLNSPPVPHA